jgi:PPM family protein phosphatase
MHPFSETPLLPDALSVTGLSDIGRVRRRNEDSLSLIPDLGVAVVADGMGGHPGGDVASQVAAETAARLLGNALTGLRSNGDFHILAALREAMEQSMRSAHEEVRGRGSADPELEGMGTTLTAMAVDAASGAFVVGHVGDSRAYRFRSGRLTQLTRDDTWIQQRVERGEISPERAKRSPYAHLLTQCVGLEDTPVPQLLEGRAEPGDAFLLCTDGLVGMLEDREMERLLGVGLAARPAEGGKRDRAAAVRGLLEAANEAGGHDNVTAALIVYAP